MPEQTSRVLNHFALYAFKDTYWQLSSEERRCTEWDTPLHTAIYHPAEETLALF